MKKLNELIEELWSAKPLDLDAKKNHWNQRADEFNQHKKNERVEQIVRYLVDKGALGEGKKVLDIGCGTGRYAQAFSETGALVKGIDLSENMITYAKQNALESKIVNATFDVVAWEHIDIDKQGWGNAFDLVTAIMTPAISSKKELDKMLKASARFGLMSTHINRFEKQMLVIEKNVLKRQTEPARMGGNLYYSFNALWQYGIHPEMTYYQMERKIERSIDEALKYYSLQLEQKQPLSDLEKNNLMDYLNSIEENGMVTDYFSSKTGWLFWENGKERIE